jgi:hypothetical protein
VLKDIHPRKKIKIKIIDAWMGTVAASDNNQVPCPLY